MEKSLDSYVNEYRKQLEIGDIRKAYKGIIEYILKFKNHLIHTYPDFFISDNLYQGCMDISYFTFTPESLKNKGLKIAIIFNHEKIRFEVWLVGRNKQVQEKYWKLFRKNKEEIFYIIPPTAQYSVAEKLLVENPEFEKPDQLTEQIENGIMEFINNILYPLSHLVS